MELVTGLSRCDGSWFIRSMSLVETLLLLGRELV